jgi:hypothetical protein
MSSQNLCWTVANRKEGECSIPYVSEGAISACYALESSIKETGKSQRSGISLPRGKGTDRTQALGGWLVALPTPALSNQQ